MDSLEKLNSDIRELIRENEDLKVRIGVHEGTHLRLRPRENRKKLTKREVAEIHRMHRMGFNQTTIADIYDVNPATISRTLRGIYHK